MKSDRTDCYQAKPLKFKAISLILSDLYIYVSGNAKKMEENSIKNRIMNNTRIQNFLLTVILFMSSTTIFGQKLEPKKRVIEQDTTITSKIMGKDYQLYISFPKGYSTKDTIKYPVLYVLDGQYTFPIFKSSREVMDLGNELEKVIIVGIGCGLDQASWSVNRWYDYTPSLDTIIDRKSEKQKGQLEKFLKCITTEIIPYVDTHYKTTNERGIAGHSLGGLFTAYCFLNSKGVFTRYGISSPSLWWNNEEILNQADSFFNKNKTWEIPPTKVFISVGQKEGPKMVPTMVKFSTRLESNAYENVSLNWYLFEEESHFSVVTASLTRTLSVLYGKKK